MAARSALAPAQVVVHAAAYGQPHGRSAMSNASTTGWSAPARALEATAQQLRTMPEAQWAADPYHRHVMRYWDGQRWTDYVNDADTVTRDSVG